MLIGVVVSRAVGSLIIPGLYTLSLKMKGVMLIPERVSRNAKDFDAHLVMQSPVVTLLLTETLSEIYKILATCTHNTFPVLNTDKHIVGMITRNQLITIIQHKLYQKVDFGEHSPAKVNFGAKTYSSKDVTITDRN